MTEIEISLHDLKFIRDGYKNIAENGADNMRVVGKGVDCKVECKTYKELYEHYAKSLDAAIEALEKQIPKKPEYRNGIGKIGIVRKARLQGRRKADRRVRGWVYQEYFA